MAAGLAVRVLPDELDERRMGEALDRALSDRRLRAAAVGLRAACARYDAPTTAAAILESLI